MGGEAAEVLEKWFVAARKDPGRSGWVTAEVLGTVAEVGLVRGGGGVRACKPPQQPRERVIQNCEALA